MTRLLAVLSLLVAMPASAEVLRFYGYAYDLKTDQHLYTEVHEQHVEGDRWLRGSITYYRPDGERMAFKTLDFSKDPYVPVFKMTLDADGYFEGISDAGDPIVVERAGKKGQPESKRLKRDGLTCADSGFHSLIVASFDQLMKRETINLRLAVAGMLDQFRFRARRIDDTTFEGKPAVRFQVEPDSLLRLVVDPLELAYDPDTKRLLEFRGVSNIRDTETGKQYVTRIAYYSQPPEGIGSLPPLEGGGEAQPEAADDVEDAAAAAEAEANVEADAASEVP